MRATPGATRRTSPGATCSFLPFPTSCNNCGRPLGALQSTCKRVTRLRPPRTSDSAQRHNVVLTAAQHVAPPEQAFGGLLFLHRTAEQLAAARPLLSLLAPGA